MARLDVRSRQADHDPSNEPCVVNDAIVGTEFYSIETQDLLSWANA
ncbi:hypothetical protein [Rhizobium sp. Leaf311]|nr:hypothetical protein [Rhizobium sp. Leaf311]